MFWIGQKVVCINAWMNFHLKEGTVYTVTGKRTVNSYPGLLLAEVAHYNRNLPFDTWRFRPLVEKSTDTGFAILREILDRETITDKSRAPVKIKGQ